MGWQAEAARAAAEAGRLAVRRAYTRLSLSLYLSFSTTTVLSLYISLSTTTPFSVSPSLSIYLSIPLHESLCGC